MQTIDTLIYTSDVGQLILGSYQDQLCLCNWQHKKNQAAIENRFAKYLKAKPEPADTDPILRGASQQLDHYFKGSLKQFDLPLLTVGTPFKQTVWQTLQTIAYGQTNSYAELAEKMGQPNAVRAVANANAANALSIIIPCHRIIGSNGQLTGYAGGLATKQQLLVHEGAI